MAQLTIYHGSPFIVEHPRLDAGKAYNDYGQGFYCTEHLALAKEWACPDGATDGFANEYSLDCGGLRTLNLADDGYTALHWLALLLEHRIVDTKTAVASQGKRYLAANFTVDTSSYDIIVGWRADDSYFSFARAFLQNTISLEQLSEAMRLGDLGEQVVLKTEQAFGALSFVQAHPAQARTFYPNRIQRDERARRLYRRISEERGLSGIYLRDMIIENMGADDARIR